MFETSVTKAKDNGDQSCAPRDQPDSIEPVDPGHRLGLICETLAPDATGATPNLSSLPGVPLLRVCHRPEAGLQRDHATGAMCVALPMAPLPSIQGYSGATDVWSLRLPAGRPARSSARAMECGPVQALRAGDVLAGAALFDSDPLGPSVTATYRALLDLLREEDMHLVRVWNAVPDINQVLREDGKTIDRYMVFCRARSLAMKAELGQDFPTHLSAASAVGATGNRGIVLFLAARTPGTRISNPRQEEAWRYPERYGPCSPSFARATRLGPELGGQLLVSGTASIIGCESLHPGDPLAQLDETLANLEALLREASTANPEEPLRDLSQLRVFVKHPEHLAQFQERLMPRLAAGASVHWVKAPICRDELLIEIEGLAR
ncbi:MAG: chorismate lyase/3-hydroxybenzoate synthase [Planctomycetota bacterium]|jgi:chorismate lyase/3-hydroxybenzoate synthase